MFTSLAIFGTTQNLDSNDITANPTGLTIVAFVAVTFCVLGAVILSLYNEKGVMKTLSEKKIPAGDGEGSSAPEEEGKE